MILPAEIEQVAREACKQMGLDADDMLYGDPGTARTQRWTIFSDEARKAIAFARAVAKLEGGDERMD